MASFVLPVSNFYVTTCEQNLGTTLLFLPTASLKGCVTEAWKQFNLFLFSDDKGVGSISVSLELHYLWVLCSVCTLKVLLEMLSTLTFLLATVIFLYCF